MPPARRSAILDRYPADDHPHCPLPPMVPHFAFPGMGACRALCHLTGFRTSCTSCCAARHTEGVLFSRDPQPPTYFTFVLTDDKGDVLYGMLCRPSPNPLWHLCMFIVTRHRHTLVPRPQLPARRCTKR
jgi:hypothetical protein